MISHYRNAIVAAALCLPPLQFAFGQHPQQMEAVSRLVQQLGSDSYRERQLAVAKLNATGVAAKNALTLGLDSSDPEIRLRCRRMLASIAEKAFDREVDDLLNRFDIDRAYDLPGWKIFSNASGHDPLARVLYVRLLERERAFLRWLQTVDEDSRYDIDEHVDDLSRYMSLEIGRLNSGDPSYWSMMLLAANNPKINRLPILGSRLRGGLQCPLVVRSLSKCIDRTPIRGLIRNWLELQSTIIVSHSALRISMLYEFDELANTLALRALQEGTASPAAVQSALFVIATNADANRSLITQALEDNRVCQVWQIATSRRRAIQTQVNDTALALLLNDQGIDPRQVGYLELQADPLTIFNGQSLGFESNAQRSTAHRRGRELLGLAEVQTPER